LAGSKSAHHSAIQPSCAKDYHSVRVSVTPSFWIPLTLIICAVSHADATLVNAFHFPVSLAPFPSWHAAPVLVAAVALLRLEVISVSPLFQPVFALALRPPAHAR